MKRGRQGVRGERTIAVLDVGTSKVAAMIALVGPEQEVPRVIGVHQLACNGMRNGLVADLELVEGAVRQAMDRAERNAGVTVEEVTLSVSAGGLESDTATVEVDIGGQRIEAADLDHIHAEARAQIDPGGREVLHADPALYIIDRETSARRPVGLHADTLGVAIHVLSADAAPMRNLETAVRSADLDVVAKIPAPLAAARACLSQQEKDLGVALVDLGAGRTNVAIFAEGMLAGFASISMGGGDVTADIASALGTPRATAERLKAVKGSANALPRDNHEPLDIPGVADDGSTVQRRRAELVQAIRGRLDTIFGLVEERFEELGYKGPRAGQVVLTGGGAA
ncbi:MAG: cell division protein FtsA, partial [Pacificimonas sp.]